MVNLPPRRDRYELGQQIGEGGMAFVFEAHDRETGTTVAVKRMRLACMRDPQMKSRFRREIQIASQLDHRHCIDVLDQGVDADGVPFFVMPRLNGMSLDECFLRPVPPGQSAAIGAQVLDALCHVHGLGFAHRDIKPENIFLIGGPGQVESVVLIDFGLAKYLSQTMAANGLLTFPGTVMGTPGAMSPEQIRADEVDHRTDLYGVGVVMYTLLAGARPFATDEVELGQLLRQQVHGDYAPLADHIPAALRAFVDTLLTPNPDERPLSAEVAAAELDSIRRLLFDDRSTWHDLFAPPVRPTSRKRVLTEIRGEDFEGRPQSSSPSKIVAALDAILDP